MCRLFGLKSIRHTEVLQSLLSANNALKVQSAVHRDGWGVTYYVGGSPMVVKSTTAAQQDDQFDAIAGTLVSDTVVAHVRRATIGSVAVENTHPFRFEHWTFAHNGHIERFPEFYPLLLEQVNPHLRRYIQGQTDSELLFFILLSEISRFADPLQQQLPLAPVITAVQRGIERIVRIVGPFNREDGISNVTYLSFLLSNGEILLGHQGGKSLHASTYKKGCPQKSTCLDYSRSCEAPSLHGVVSHLILASEPLQDINVWEPLQPGEIAGVDGNLIYRKVS